MKKALQIIYKTLISFITLIFLYVIFASTLSIIPSIPNASNEKRSYEIFIKSNGIHTDVIIPKDNLSESIESKLNQELSNYLAFGWGDKGFYIDTPTWNDLTFSVAVKAMFLSSETVMHVTPYESINSAFVSLRISKPQLEELLNYIEVSFQLDSNKFKKIDFEGYSDMDAFYKAKGSYSLFKTCNVWTGEALKGAGIKTGIWSPFDWGIIWNL